MTTIDQRILIPVRQDVVWAYVSDLRNNAEWQADCQGISFLSTKHDGVGTRWRSTTGRGKDTVLEVTTWYNGLGYEYVFVDGVTIKNTKGRLRLQEIPEGTVVQWTFSFEGGGLLGAGRTARQFDGTMAASLKALYKQLKALNQSGEIGARSLIREAPDVEARAAYKPRHPSAAESSAGPDEDAVLLPVDGEPTIGLQDAALVAAIDLKAEPPVAVEDTKPRPAVDGDERFAPKPEPAAAVAIPVTPPAPEHEAAPAEIEPEPVITEAEPAAPPPDRTAAALAAAAAAAALPPTDSQGKSIWEVFGVERPSAESAATASAVSAESDKGDAPVLEADSVQVETAEPQPVEAAATVEPAAVPDPQETVPLEAVPSPAVTVPVVATVIAAVPDPVTSPDGPAAEPAVVVAPPAVSPAGQPRRGLRIIERRRRVNLRLPG